MILSAYRAYNSIGVTCAVMGLALIPTSSLQAAVSSEDLSPEGKGTVLGVHSGPEADFVAIDGGWLTGFRAGMVLEAHADREWVADLLVADIREHACIAMIVDISSNHAVQVGDLVRLKNRSY